MNGQPLSKVMAQRKPDSPMATMVPIIVPTKQYVTRDILLQHNTAQVPKYLIHDITHYIIPTASLQLILWSAQNLNQWHLQIARFNSILNYSIMQTWIRTRLQASSCENHWISNETLIRAYSLYCHANCLLAKIWFIQLYLSQHLQRTSTYNVIHWPGFSCSDWLIYLATF